MADKVTIMPVGKVELASGLFGEGRMAEPDIFFEKGADFMLLSGPASAERFFQKLISKNRSIPSTYFPLSSCIEMQEITFVI
jgi:hypothetical protein